MNKNYLAPQVSVIRMMAATITTVSTETSWDDKWSEVLQEEDNAYEKPPMHASAVLFV